MFLTNLFGHTKGAYTGAETSRKGLVNLADEGVLFLDEVHCLKAECQEKLFQFMDKGTYHMVGDNDTWYRSNARLIFATTEDPESSLLRTLQRRIPIVAKVPSLAERSLSEKRLLIHYILQIELERMGRKISISHLAYRALMGFSFPGNVGQLINSVQAGLAKAILHCEQSDEVLLYLSNLPQEIIEDAVALLEGDILPLEDFVSVSQLNLDSEESNQLNTQL